MGEDINAGDAIKVQAGLLLFSAIAGSNPRTFQQDWKQLIFANNTQVFQV